MSPSTLSDLSAPSTPYENAPIRLTPPAGRVLGAGGLPVPLTSLVGREREIETCTTLLHRDSVRLLTLTGPGGVGKTRLAVRVAAEVGDSFADGAVFVALASVRDPGLVLPTIALAFEVQDAEDQPLTARLATALQGRELLLVLDNFEQVLPAAPWVADLLADCPSLKVLVTSRAVLHISGEHDLTTPPLELPDLDHLPPPEEMAQCEAVQLFIERARAANPEFALTIANAVTVASICRRLDGLPLAIELAATRTRVLSPRALLARLSNRLQVLTGGPHDAPARLRTMREAIAWSYDLLDCEEQRLLRRLAVFTGGCTLDAVDAVMRAEGRGPSGETTTSESSALGPPPSALELLAALVDHSLLRRVDQADGEPRFVMLETIREFALERLAESGEERAARTAHAAFSLTLAEAAEPMLRGREQGAWLAQLEADHDNLRAALAWSLEHDGAIALRLAGALHWFWSLRSHYREGRRWLEAALALSAAAQPTAARIKALAGAGVLAYDQADYAVARQWLDESADLAQALGDCPGHAYALLVLGTVAYRQGDYATARVHLEESANRCRAIGDDWGLAAALTCLGYLTSAPTASSVSAASEEALGLFRTLGDAWGLARAANFSGETARAGGDFDRAEALYEESLARYRELGDRNTAALVLHNLGYVAQGQGDPRRGATYLVDALTSHAEHGDRRGVAFCLAGVAGMVGVLGQTVEAARLFGAAQVLFDATGAAMDPVDGADYSRNLAAVRDRLDEQTFASAWEAGRELSLEAALVESIRAVAAVAKGELETATIHGAAAEDAGLTSRELEVLRLLVEGRSDREIGAMLFISRSTVVKHVAAIRTKLHVSTRTAAASAALRRQVV